MTNWPTLKSSDITKGLKKAGFQLVRQKGSHARFEHEDGRVTTVPVHAGQDVGRGLLRKILRDIEMSSEEFRRFLT
ncbi:MAG: type II toxin-antitoxin system HicA family toxin [Deltaproteobacteria bacterium]|nr:type II toxin-antitoxin system HicA family toxin [Deltaproteobacteria bacterium]